METTKPALLIRSSCSLVCYRKHRGADIPLQRIPLTVLTETCSPSLGGGTLTPSPPTDPPSDTLQDPTPLHPLTSLNWPYIPDDSTYDDPLKRDDPKPLRLHQYEAIGTSFIPFVSWSHAILATSPTVRSLLTSNPDLRAFLTTIDNLRGTEREEALQRALGVDSKHLRNNHAEMEQDTRAFGMLAEAIETAVRGGKEDMLGLDWDDQ